MNKHKSNKIKENYNTVRHLIMGQIITTQNLVATKVVRLAGQQGYPLRGTISTMCVHHRKYILIFTKQFNAQRPLKSGGGGRVTQFPFGVSISHRAARVNSQNRPDFEGDYRNWWLTRALLGLLMATSRGKIKNAYWNVILLNVLYFFHWVAPAEFLYGCYWVPSPALRWRHNERDGVSNHRRLDCLHKRLFGRRSKKTPKFRFTGLCEGTGDRWIPRTKGQ